MCRSAGNLQLALAAVKSLKDSRIPKTGLIIVATTSIFCVSGCSGMNTKLAQEQRQSLDFVFYRDNPQPPAPTADELRLTRNKIQDAQPWERELLEHLYPRNLELWTLATRDSDKDGIFDFRVSDYYGRFLEGDTDLDGDQIDNALDPAPFDASNAPGAAGEIPAHVNWEHLGKPTKMVRIQQELFEKNRILLVERSAEFTPVLAQSVYDVVSLVYRIIFQDHGVLPTLRIISTEASSLLYADAEDGSGDFAQVFAATQTMEIYQRGIDAVSAIQLGFLAHEISHNIQFSLDYDAQRQDEIIRRNYFAAEHFLERVEPYGWTLVSTDPEPEAEYNLFRPQYLGQESYEHLYLEKTPEEWEVWLAEIYDEVGAEAYLSDERVTGLRILGNYSLSGPWEWYSDEVVAYVYLAMLDSLATRCPAADWEALRQDFQDNVVAAEWPYFRFENARGAAIQE